MPKVSNPSYFSYNVLCGLSPVHRAPITIQLVANVVLILSLVFNVGINIDLNQYQKGTDMKQTTHQPSFRNGHATKDQETFGTGCVGRRVGDTGLVHMSNLLGCTPHSTTDLARVFDHTGSSFDSFLEEEGILDEVDATATKRVVEWQLDIAAQADAMEGIRQGLEDARLGRLRPAREFFAEFEAKHGISHD